MLYAKLGLVGSSFFQAVSLAFMQIAQQGVMHEHQDNKALEAGDCASRVRHASRQAFFCLRVYTAPRQTPRPPQRHGPKRQFEIPLGKVTLGDNGANR
jgi:hypothetical protein